MQDKVGLRILQNAQWKNERQQATWDKRKLTLSQKEKLFFCEGCEIFQRCFGLHILGDAQFCLDKILSKELSAFRVALDLCMSPSVYIILQFCGSETKDEAVIYKSRVRKYFCFVLVPYVVMKTSMFFILFSLYWWSSFVSCHEMPRTLTLLYISLISVLHSNFFEDG